MTFAPNSLPPVAPGTAVVDYRLQRSRLLRELEDGLVGRDDVCDAHPELRRAGEHVGRELDGDCPVCESAGLRAVTYVFGPRLPAGGRCVVTAGDEERIRRRKGSFTAYAVEVCPGCGWNHLLEAFRIEGRG